MRRPSSLLLLLALVGGLAASAVHHAEHAAEWAEGREHQAAHHGTDGAHAPCADGDVHALDCAVCASHHAAPALADAPTLALADTDRPPGPDAAVRGVAADAASARGPPAVA
ncbi:hypothetical protein [Rubrivirga sp. IMCC45206]|uniref:hypothetical protein n=1 Tax=Rubrivirga sp. IMCC45206 TaxID=3391614 RepID=UPI00399021BA